jgi:C_GCAxxG_C_C family probable redox protein
VAIRVPERGPRLDPRIEDLAEQLSGRARHLYEHRRHLCTEAVLAALNEGLGGGLSRTQAVALAAPFCEGLGESGCLCGALSGAVMACGLLLGGSHPHRRRRVIRRSARELHDAFRMAHGATCCRILSREVKQDKRAHFRQCADLTASAAGMAARVILNARPELASPAGRTTVAHRQAGPGGALARLFRRFSLSRP